MLIFLVGIGSALSVRAYAGEDYIDKFSEILPNEKYADADYLSDSLSLSGVIEDLRGGLSEAVTGMAPTLLTLFGVSLISALASLYQGRCRESVSSGVGIISALVAYGGLCGMFSEIIGSMGEITTLFSSFIPLFSSITLAGGGSHTAVGQSLAMATTVSVFSGVITPLFSLLLSVMLALSLLSALGSIGAMRLACGVKKHILLLLSLVGAIMLATISLQTLITSSRDSAAMRTARHLAGTLIPVVGSTVSSSLSALSAGLALTKGCVGVGGIVAIVTVFLTPLLSLLVYRGAVGLLHSAEDLLSVSSPTRGVSECLDLLIGVYSLSAVIYIFEIVLFIKGGVGAI